MRKISTILAVVVILCASLGLPGCFSIYGEYDNKASASSLSSLAAQAPGAISALSEVALATPVDAATKEQIAGYAKWAKLGADAVSGISTALSAPDAASQATGAVQAINTIVQQTPLDSGTKETVGNWSSWALLALKAAATIVPLIL